MGRPARTAASLWVPSATAGRYDAWNVAGYIVFERIDGGRVRLLEDAGTPTDRRDRGEIGDVPTVEASVRSRPLAEVVRERLLDAREQWSITTFYLFDPSSWRR